MKVIIEYNLPDDAHEYELSKIADEMYNVIDEAYNKARSVLKHGEPQDYEQALEDIKDVLFKCSEVYE